WMSVREATARAASVAKGGAIGRAARCCAPAHLDEHLPAMGAQEVADGPIPGAFFGVGPPGDGPPRRVVELGDIRVTPAFAVVRVATGRLHVHPSRVALPNGTPRPGRLRRGHRVSSTISSTGRV